MPEPINLTAALEAAYDTKRAAVSIQGLLDVEKFTEADLRAWLTKHPHLAPPKWEGRFIFTEGHIEQIVAVMELEAAGLCQHCGKNPFGPEVPEPAPEPAAE